MVWILGEGRKGPASMEINRIYGNGTVWRAAMVLAPLTGRHLPLLIMLACTGSATAQSKAPAAPPASPSKQKAQPPTTKLPVPAKVAPRTFLTAKGTHLRMGPAIFENVGVNIPDLFERFLNGDDASAIKSLGDAKAQGVQLVRCWGTTW